MNTQQRKYLIDKLNAKCKEQMEELKKQKMEYPSLSNYMYLAIMNDTLKLKPQEVTLKALKEKAMNAKEGSNWLSEDRMGIEKFTTCKIDINALFEVPQNYVDKVKEVKEHNQALQAQIESIKLQMDSLETRIQLASDKTLQKMINEVDDMGDISLIDTKIKLLNT